MIVIRPEIPEDIPAIREINRRAFETPVEAALVDTLRASRAMTLSLVALLEGVPTGHICFSPVMVVGAHGRFEATGLGPMAVLPERQRSGIGSELVKTGLEELRQMGAPAVFVLGHAGFYPRFGFLPASHRSIHFSMDVPDEAFMLLELRPGALQGISGTVYYRQEFYEAE